MTFSANLLTVNRPFLIALFALDVLLIAAHTISGALLPKIPPLLNIAFDYSLGEFFNYLKWLGIVVFLVAAFLSRKVTLFLPFALVFLVMFLDDALMLHERGGEFFASSVGLQAFGGLRAQDYGELIVWGGLAALLLPALGVGILRSAPEDRAHAIILFGLIALFAVFGGALDVLHFLVANLPYGIQVFDLMEDGGEMMVASVILAHAATLPRQTGQVTSI